MQFQRVNYAPRVFSTLQQSMQDCWTVHAGLWPSYSPSSKSGKRIKLDIALFKISTYLNMEFI